MTEKEVEFDFGRRARLGLSEAVLCAGKSPAQIEYIASLSVDRDEALLLTRLDTQTFNELSAGCRDRIDFDAVSGTGIIGMREAPMGPASVAVVAAGSSDVSVVREATRTLAFHGQAADEIIDIGVAGLWRVLDKHEQLDGYPVVIVVAGMDGALFSVLGGLVGGAVIAVPTATGYGAARGGRTALNAALASCAPGVVAVNIGNGYGAACAAVRVLGAGRAAGAGTEGAS